MSEKLLDESVYQNQHQLTFCFREENWRTFICELIGTALLVTGVCLTIYKNPVDSKVKNTIMMHDVFVIMTLYMVRCVFAPLTGGYFNLAVTLGVFLNKNSNNKISAKRLAFYVVGQLIGATIGATFSKIVFNAYLSPFQPEITYTAGDIAVRFAGQLIDSGTVVFVHMVLVLTTNATTFVTEQCWIHLFVPIFLYGGRKLSKYVDGLNPFQMITLQSMASLFAVQKSEPLHIAYILILAGAQLLGGVLAATFFNYVYYPMMIKWRNQE